MVATLIFLGLAVWRVTYMLVAEKGPLDVFARLRAYFARNQKRSGGLFDLISCPFCVSIWVGALGALLICENVLTFIIYTLILSSEAIFYQRVFDKLK